jgi:dihydrofolate reductase
MCKLIYSMTVSLDGYISGPDGEFDWSAPDEELHRFHNDQVRELGGHLLGRRLYEVMSYWETAEESDPAAPRYALEFARIWKDLPKIVYSNTLTRVEGKTRLSSEDPVADVPRRSGWVAQPSPRP